MKARVVGLETDDVVLHDASRCDSV